MIGHRFAAVLAVALLGSPAAADEIADVAAALSDTPYIAVGERHDNADHHRLQAELVAALAPAGLAFEMIPRDVEDDLNRLRREGAERAEIAALLSTAAPGWDWDDYLPILDAAPSAYIAGGGLSKTELRAVYGAGAKGLGEDMAARYRLAERLDKDARAEMLDEQFSAHCEMLPREQLGAMVEVQRAWDAAYAEAWHRAAVKGGGASVLITGNGHSRLDRGAPASLLRAEPGAEIASVGLLEGDETDTDGLYTMILTAPAPEREDPCIQMRKAMEKTE